MSQTEKWAPLEILDPGHGDPSYWRGFQDRVMSRVRPNLARRRGTPGVRGEEITLGSVMLSWSRLILPTTAVAVAVVFLLFEPSVPVSEEVSGVEEALVLPREGEEPFPTFLYSDEAVDRDVVLFAVEGF